MVKIGIEIHQRLEGRKLFCDCSTQGPAEDELPQIKITRRLHPVFSELGEADEASQAEFAKDRVFEYQVFSKNNCLVEMDEEPPNLLNQDALNTVLQIAFQLHATPVDEIHIMRKMVIDGSNTSGFQRTAIVAMNGHLDSSKGTIGIPLIAIEEESAGIISASEGKAEYRLDRLGIPLIEITTTPDIKDGAHLSEVAEKLGMILRMSGKVARGIGTIRQDVNISTEGGSRVEIKGAQDLKMLPLLVEIEAKRQAELLSILLALRHRKALPLKEQIIDLSGIFRSTGANMISSGLKSGSVVLGQLMPSHKGILGAEIQPGRRYGTELSDYAKKAGVKGIIHSDEDLGKYKISKEEEGEVRKMLGAGADDAFVLVIAPAEQAKRAILYALARANMDFVPPETRRANPDGTSTYMRPLSGRARLYPETDVPPVPLTKELLASVSISESLEEKRTKLEAMLNRDMAQRMLKSRHLHIFERLVAAGAEPMLAATTLEDTLVSLRRDGVEFSDIEKTLGELFEEYSKHSFVRAAIPDILKGMAKGARIDAVLKVFRLQRIRGAELEALAKESGYDLKQIMQKYRLQVDAKEAAEIVKKSKSHDYV